MLQTIKTYPASVRSLANFLRANDMPAGVEDVTTEGIRAFLVSAQALESQNAARLQAQPAVS